jgi:ribosome-binding protein aMBF1 (putative translation factor)
VSTGGFIYAIGAVGTTYVKIGSARDVEKRRKELQTGQPFLLHILATIPVETSLRRIETQIHRFLAEQRQQGEWFDLPMDTERLVALVARAVQWLDEQDAMKTFGQRLKSIREQRGWSQSELAERAGVPYETIYRVERGTHQEPRVSIAAKLARTLGVSLDVLAGLYEDERQPAAVA